MSNPKGRNRVFSIRIRPLWDHIQVTLGSLVVYGVTLGSLLGSLSFHFWQMGVIWGGLGVTLEWLWDDFGTLWRHLWHMRVICGGFGVTLG